MPKTKKKSFFKPIKKSCVHEQVCADYPAKCKACGFNPNNKKAIVPETKAPQGIRGIMQEAGKKYGELPPELRFT